MSGTIKDAKESKEGKENKVKKRRTIKTESAVASPSTNDTKKNVRSIFYQEETEVETRDINKDLEMHSTSCGELRKMMGEIKKLKNAGKTQGADYEDKRIHGTLQFVTLKKLNRLAHIRCKKVRDQTNDSKQKIDTQQLQLQNLLYEVMHLHKEVTKCLEFKSTDEEINLVPVKEFYAEAPKQIAKPELTKSDIHQQTLARLDWELEQRKQLSEKLMEAKGSKQEIEKEIETKKEYLDNLQPKLNAILQATKPVQEHLEMPFDEMREQRRTAHYLPRPLYVLYVQASAYNDACDKHLTVSIQGDIDVARSMENASTTLDEESDSDQEDEKEEKEKKKHSSHRRRLGSESQSQKAQKVLKKHPLSISVVISCKDGSTLELVFSYLLMLEIVTVTVNLQPGPEANFSTVSGGDLLSPDSVLHCLYPDDVGEDTPNPANQYLLSRMGLGEFRKHVSVAGRPYLWAQWMCGVDFLQPEANVDKASSALSASHMESTIRRLRHRVRARLSLQKQLASIERCSVPVSREYMNLFPTKVSSRLTAWRRVTYEDMEEVPYASNLLAAGLVKEADTFFTGTLDRGSAKMTVYCAVPANYPNSAPLFALSVMWKTGRNGLNSQDIRDIEAEVNIHYPELVTGKSHEQLLTNQLQRLLMCFDVYLETEAENHALEGPNEFAKEKMFPRLNRGRQRGKPYVFNPQLGYFSQR